MQCQRHVAGTWLLSSADASRAHSCLSRLVPAGADAMGVGRMVAIVDRRTLCAATRDHATR